MGLVKGLDKSENRGEKVIGEPGISRKGAVSQLAECSMETAGWNDEVRWTVWGGDPVLPED